MTDALKKEIIKQLGDQSLHLAMGIASVGLINWAFGSIVLAVGITIGWEAYREWGQWPSSRPWDPPLDFAFEALGIIAGYYIFN